MKLNDWSSICSQFLIPLSSTDAWNLNNACNSQLSVCCNCQVICLLIPIISSHKDHSGFKMSSRPDLLTQIGDAPKFQQISFFLTQFLKDSNLYYSCIISRGWNATSSQAWLVNLSQHRGRVPRQLLAVLKTPGLYGPGRGKRAFKSLFTKIFHSRC